MPNQASKKPQAPDCTICMTNKANCSLNACEHTFCYRCIKKWSKTRSNCPLCRKSFTNLRYKNRHIPIEPTGRDRSQRTIVSREVIPRGLIYVPVLYYTTAPCLIYNPLTQNYFNSLYSDAQTSNMSLAPSFFIPTL